MKKLLLTIFTGLMMWSIYAQEIEVSHKISKVTVYMNSAEIIREAAVHLPAGKSTLIFKGISGYINNRGLQISLPQGVKMYNIGIEKVPVKFKYFPEWKNIQKRYVQNKDSLELLNIRVSSLNNQILFLKKNMELKANTLATVNQLNTRADYFQRKIESIHLKIYNIQRQIKRIQERLKIIREEKNKLENKLKKRNTIIKAVVVAQAPVDTTIYLRYSVGQAQWQPYYAIYATENNATLEFHYQAQIYNNTGNDWNQQKLTLAILNTNDNLDLPKLKTWVLSDYVYDDYSEGLLNTDARGIALESTNTAIKDSVIKSGVKYNVIKVDDINTKFEVEALQDIPSDAVPHMIDVKIFHPKVEYFSLSIPKVKQGAFLIAKLPHWRQMGLMDGKMDLFYNQTFQGTSMLDTRQIGDTLNISLGRDKSFYVYRRKMKSRNKEKIIGLYLLKELTYEIVVQNNKNIAQEIELRDQLPVAGDNDIKVIPVDFAGAVVDNISGQLTWKLHLKPLETRKIIFSFKVKYPKSKRDVLDGVDDRKIMSPRFF